MMGMNSLRGDAALAFLYVVGFIGWFVLNQEVAAAEPRHDASVHVYSSPVEQSVMIELYTSEGCNSCPPAEAYLNRYKERPGLWQRYIPLAFHVDYWDYLGWQDPYASAAHSERQHDYARHHRHRTVYTPAFFVNGRPWRYSSARDEPPVSQATPGRLSMTVDGENVSLRFEPLGKPNGALTYHVAILGMGLESSIEAGENAGRHARHEFVVLSHQRGTRKGLTWQTTLARFARKSASRLAIVGWVSRGDSPIPRQATGGYLPAGFLH